MRKKFMILSALAVLCCFALLAGCGGASDSEEGDALTLLIQKSDSEKIYIQRIMELYEEKTGGRIEMNVVDDVEFDRVVGEAFESGNLPDLYFEYNGSSLEMLDIPEHFYYMNDEAWVGELTDGVLASCLDRDENVLGLPFWENSLSGCYYNKKVLDELGLKPAATQTEFDALCAALKTVGHTPLYWAANSCNWMFQFGLDPIFADDPELLEKLNRNEITYADIPAVVDMVTWLDNANKQGWFNANYRETAWDDIAPALANGESIFLFVWDTWFDTDLGRQNGKYTRDDFAVMPVFMNTTQMGTYEGGNMNMLLVNKNSPRLEMALEFLNFCATPENYNAAFDGVSTVSCFKNQTTNIQSGMVTDASVSIEANRRASTAWLKIAGYRQDDVGAAVLKLFDGEVDVAGCIQLMDEYRINAARELGVEGF